MNTAICLLLMSAVLARAEDLKPVNVKTTLPGCCYAGSRPDPKAFGGYGPSGNTPKRNTKDIGKRGAVSLLALPDETHAFGKEHRGFSLLLINNTKSEKAFPASDSRLPIIREAQDSKGQWRPIEDLPISSCGNSDHRVFLPAHRYWKFTVPTYSGRQSTRLRFVLQTTPPIYSNEFEGTINRGQFTK